jgi:hypothetical protein
LNFRRDVFANVPVKINQGGINRFNCLQTSLLDQVNDFFESFLVRGCCLFGGRGCLFHAAESPEVCARMGPTGQIVLVFMA